MSAWGCGEGGTHHGTCRRRLLLQVFLGGLGVQDADAKTCRVVEEHVQAEQLCDVRGVAVAWLIGIFD